MRGYNVYPSLSSLSRNIAAGLVLALVIALSAMPLVAQIDTGSVTGTVSDPSGAVVSGAKVTLTNQDTSATLSVTTSSDGLYNFTPVRIGNYTLTATAQGFQTTSQKNITVNVGSAVLVNMALKTGQVTETVEVTTGAPVLETQNASVGQVVNSKSVNDLPLNGRNFTFLAQLAAGVNTPQADTRGNASTGAFAANGLRPAQNNYMLDGIDNNSDTVDFLNGTNFVVLPPVDAIQEFKVQTSGFSAEYGRSGAAVLNASIKSGTNSFHGTAWEFLRNDAFDGRDWFEPASSKKGEFRQNQFGVSIGGPVIKNKVFFFGDYEGLRRRQGVPHQGTVPTDQERSSGFTNFQELITGQSGTQTDILGRTMPTGTILDPSTTRAANGGFVRDPFGTCPASTTNYTLAACNLNILPAGRLDQNAIGLLNLFPAATNGQLSSNFSSSPKLSENRNAFDTRVDFNLSDKNQIFARFSLVDDPQMIPGIFGGVPDGGGFQEGNQTAIAEQSALAYTHVFSSSMVNEVRAGLSYLHTTRVSPAANDLSDLPGSFGIAGIPQEHENGGLPAFGIQGLQTLGSNAFLPSDEVSSTFQVTDNFTKIYGKHTFKMGFEFQHVKFSTLQPPWSRGQFNFDGAYTNIPGASTSSENTGIAQFLLTPIAAQNGGTVDYLGGPSAQNGGTAIYVSNISLTDNGKNYYGSYFNDDWKVTPKLTVNLGLRWDFFGLVLEHHANQANFVPSGAPFGGPAYIIPKGGANTGSLSTSFTDLLATDGIKLAVTDQFGKGLGNSQKANFAPRFGFAYQVTPKLVARGGFGLFYNGFENRGFSPNLGENYPFQFNFSFNSPKDDSHPIVYSGCTSPTAGPIGNATLETGFSCTPLDPSTVIANGLALRGIQFNYVTPYSMGGNLTLQYQVTPTMSVQAGYVTSLARHLEVFPGSNNPTQINGPLPFPDFGQNASYATTDGNSHYHALQTRLEKQFSHGLNLLATYTWSQTRTDAVDLLNGGSGQGYRAPNFPDFGIRGDYGLAPFDIRNVVHISGGYELPFGKGKKYLSDAGGFADKVAGGWSVQFIATLQGGQPITLPCANGTASGTGCYDFKTGDAKLGLHRDSQDQLNWIGNAAAFTQPCQLDSGGNPNPASVLNCVPLTGNALLGGSPSQIPGPGFHRLDFSTFKDFQLNERFRLQFRAEFFNILNHPNFNAPGFGGNGVVAISGATNYTSSNFGEIGSTRDAPNDPRQIQFALKLYF
ncbi:MAG TPA: TonB-dependent receptor [Terriglobales bacterium]|nr:TonB-dependent receptor [Terriglobales bacterium]